MQGVALLHADFLVSLHAVKRARFQRRCRLALFDAAILRASFLSHDQFSIKRLRIVIHCYKQLPEISFLCTVVHTRLTGSMPQGDWLPTMQKQ